MKHISRLIIALLMLTTIGCTQVKPWERGNLARPDMALTPDPMDAKIRNHIYHSKEGSVSIATGSGGGCGCN